MSKDVAYLHRSFGFFLILVLSFYYGSPGLAAVHPCSISGTYWVLVDTNGNGVPDEPPHSSPAEIDTALIDTDPASKGYDSFWTMSFDDAINQLEVIGHGISPSIFLPFDSKRYDLSIQGDNIILQKVSSHNDHGPPANPYRITASKVGGAPDYNHLEFSWDDPKDLLSASAILVDADGHGLYDRVQGRVHLVRGLDILFDSPIQFYSSDSGKQYWHIPARIPIGLGLTIPGPKVRISRPFPPGPVLGPRTSGYDIFVPVGVDALEFRCGSNAWGRVTLNAGVGGRTETEAVMSLNAWCSIVAILLFLIACIWVMGKRGFEDRVSKL